MEHQRAVIRDVADGDGHAHSGQAEPHAHRLAEPERCGAEREYNREEEDPRLSPPAGIGNRAEKGREHRDAQPGIALDFRPQRLAAHRIADDVAAEIGRVDVDGDDEHIGIATPLVEHPGRAADRRDAG